MGAILARLAAIAAEDGAAASEPDREALRLARAQSVLAEIDRRFADPDFARTQAAAALGLSLRSLHIAMEPTGFTFSDHLTRRRLAEARRRLSAESRRSVLEIALACGFNDLSTFYRSFRPTFGGAPREIS